MINRIEPQLPAAAYKTYQIISPKSTHFRKATCEEVDCPAYRNGWITRVPANSDLENLVRNSGRRWRGLKHEGAEVVFIFDPGTECFESSKHTVRLERPEIYVVTGGDFRGNPLGTEPVRHKNAADWVDDFANHQDKIARQIERG